MSLAHAGDLKQEIEMRGAGFLAIWSDVEQKRSPTIGTG